MRFLILPSDCQVNQSGSRIPDDSQNLVWPIKLQVHLRTKQVVLEDVSKSALLLNTDWTTVALH
uniref:Uncharacterized protein n=1 Tax=Anguilla anguilla TaxID=7936 RepID=A0A0E9WJP0_ANGAN